jgi:2-desacetyl-2-hydroxyethyl bacteriochlorophyllide A dehydrogenase
MIAVVKEKFGKGWQLRQIPKPTVAENEVLLEVKKIGICGSDMAIYDGREKELMLPVVPGHEFGGEIIDCGLGVADLVVGNRVVVNLVKNCGRCYYCRRGDANLCLDTNLIGFHTNGGFAEYATVPAKNCHLIPDSMSWEDAAAVDPVTSALAAFKKTGIKSSDTVCILGPGPIGLYGCQIAKAEGAKNVIMLGTRKARLALAAKLGADHTLLVQHENPMAVIEDVQKITQSRGADVVLEASGNPDTLDLALKLAAKGGRVALVSIYHKSTQVDPMTIVFNELKVFGSFDYKWIDFEEAIQMIASGRVLTAPLTTHTFPLKEIQAGIKAMEDKQAIKVMIDP